jgi:transcriptional antiterminator RfaH
MPVSWYALRSKPRKEEAVYRQALNQGFEAYYPRIRVQPVNPRSRKVRPYFPGYLFISADLEQVGVSAFQWMPHTHGLVSLAVSRHCPGKPGAGIRKRVDEINSPDGEVLIAAYRRPGGKYLLDHLKCHEAIFDAACQAASARSLSLGSKAVPWSKRVP